MEASDLISLYNIFVLFLLDEVILKIFGIVSGQLVYVCVWIVWPSVRDTHTTHFKYVHSYVYMYVLVFNVTDIFQF
jgi:hypothetical protein